MCGCFVARVDLLAVVLVVELDVISEPLFNKRITRTQRTGHQTKTPRPRVTLDGSRGRIHSFAENTRPAEWLFEGVFLCGPVVILRVCFLFALFWAHRPKFRLHKEALVVSQ